LTIDAGSISFELNPRRGPSEGFQQGDVHRCSNVEGGVSGGEVAEAHQGDVDLQSKYGVEYKRSWVDEKAGKIFCLVEAPDAETAHRVHREAHGLVADEIYEVSEHS
jgi:hypothetical protein